MPSQCRRSVPQWLSGIRTCARNRAYPAPMRGTRPRCRRPGEPATRRAAKGSTTTRSSSKEAACAISSPLRIQGQRGAVEDQAVVAAHLIRHQHRNAVAARDRGQHFPAHGPLGVPERRRGKVDVQGRMLAHQFFHGIDLVEPARPEVLVVPGILTDGDGQANPVQLNHLLRLRRARNSAARQRRRRRAAAACAAREAGGPGPEEQRRSQAGLPGPRRPAGSATPASTAVDRLARGRSQFVHCPAATGEKAGLLKKVGWRIAADSQLGKDRQTRAQRGRPAGWRPRFFRDSQ